MLIKNHTDVWFFIVHNTFRCDKIVSIGEAMEGNTKAEIITGLSTQEVQERIEKGLVNKEENGQTKSYKRILYDNIVTLFNFINLVLAVLIILTGSFKNLLFLGVVFSNIVIGTFQEIRAKKTLDKISLINTMKVCAIRNGKETLISIQEIVLDEILKVKMGSQIVSDSVVIEGTLEVDESLLTGESETVIKKPGDILYSGSFVVGSFAYIKVRKIGDDNYASKLVKDAKAFQKYPSQLRDNLNKIIKYIGIMIIPLGVCMFLKEYWMLEYSFNESVLSTSAALIGMIPEGLVILTSIALAVGSIHLAKHKTLVQELYCLETLARVDVLCLDKTGTITEGKMEVDHHVKVKEEYDFLLVMGHLMYHLQDDNATFSAIQKAYPACNTWKCIKTIPFTSKNKFSGVEFEEGTYLMGAFEYLVKNPSIEQVKQIEMFAAQGYRIISVVKKEAETVEVIGFILLLDKIRDSAKQTLAYFKEQGVCIKVISGDHPITVSQVAKRAGLEEYAKYVDATTLHTQQQIEEAMQKYQIFGRVSPQQKKDMVIALKNHNHVVGMSGDGVNDVLAFKEADVSVAMASGSDIAKASANLVLLDSNFDALPHVLYEGRRVINNIQRVATLFLTKTIFSLLLSFLTIFLSVQYPFVPVHLTFVSTLTIGIPAFVLALEPNKARVEKNFLENVLKVSLPAAVSVIVCILYIVVGIRMGYLQEGLLSQLCLIVISINGLLVLTKMAKPFTPLRIALLVVVYATMCIGLLFGDALIGFKAIQFHNVWYHIVFFYVALLLISKALRYGISYIYRIKSKKNSV